MHQRKPKDANATVHQSLYTCTVEPVANMASVEVLLTILRTGDKQYTLNTDTKQIDRHTSVSIESGFKTKNSAGDFL